MAGIGNFCVLTSLNSTCQENNLFLPSGRRIGLRSIYFCPLALLGRLLCPWVSVECLAFTCALKQGCPAKSLQSHKAMWSFSGGDEALKTESHSAVCLACYPPNGAKGQSHVLAVVKCCSQQRHRCLFEIHQARLRAWMWHPRRGSRNKST